jgi:hypothetical protein
MSDLSKGYTFSGTSPNNNITAEKLNALVDQATIQTGFYTDRSEANSGSDTDLLLIYNASSFTFKKIRKGNLITAGVAKTGFTNLSVQNNAAAPDSRLDVTADELVLRAITGNVRYISAFSRTVDLESYSGAATADGRDFATENADTWYYVWAISDGTNDRLLVSASRTSPTLPSGFTYRALLGAARNDHSSNFVRFIQRNCEVAIAVASKAGVASANLNPKTGATPVEFTSASCDTLGAFQSVDLAQCIPPAMTARVRGIIGQSTDSGGTNYVYAVASKGTGALDGSNTPSEAIGLQLLTSYLNATAGQMFGFYNAASFEVPVHTSQTMYWTTNTGTLRHNLRINGYTLAL